MTALNLIFDWGDTLMRDDLSQKGPMFTWEKIELIDGVLETIKSLSITYTLSVATNAGVSDEAAVRKAFARMGIEQYFTHFFTSKELGYQKPDIRFFQAIQNKLQVPTSHCIMIGNSYQNDIVGAQEAGMKTIFFNEKKLEGDFPNANKIIQHFSEVMDAVVQMQNSLLNGD